MAICPQHGGYSGDGCRKCQKDELPMKLVGTGTVADPQIAVAVGSLPKLDEHDKFELMRLENASLKSFHAMQNAQAQFQNFARAMFEKYGVSPGGYTLDMEKLEFVARAL